MEQIVLARNRVQHGEHLSMIQARHEKKILTAHQAPIFARENELKLWFEEGADPDTWLAPQLEITEENLAKATTEVDRLADWVEERIPNIMEHRYSRN